MRKKNEKFNVSDAISYLKHTSLIISSFLRDRKLSIKLHNEVEKEVKKVLSCCEGCGTWDSKSKIVDQLCGDCQEDKL